MKREIVIPFDGDSSQASRDTLIKALEEQLEKYKADGGDDAGMKSKGNASGAEVRNV
jgi:hypothetical protein